MRLNDDKRQKNQLQQSLAFPESGRSEAPEGSRRGTESSVVKHKSESPASSEQLVEEICERENCKQALARVKSNKGSPGIDGMTVEKLPDYLKRHGPEVREQLLSGTAGEAGGNPETGWRDTQAGYPDVASYCTCSNPIQDTEEIRVGLCTQSRNCCSSVASSVIQYGIVF